MRERPCRAVRPLLVSLALSAALAAPASVPAAERQALIDLYTSTNGPSWTNRTGWLGAAGTECSWYGVTCDAAMAHVDTIDLGTNNLSGPLPASLARLTALAKLSIWNDPVTGSLADLLGWLPQLEVIFLPGTRVTGPIPSGIGAMPRLQRLMMHRSPVGGTLPESLGSVRTLTSLGLNQAGLTGPLPASLGNLTALEQLGFDGNGLTGPIPAELGQLTNLTGLDLARNQLSGPLPESLGNLVKLTDVDLSSNRLTGGIPASLGNLTALQSLYLSRNQLTGPIPESFGRLTSLKVLGLHWNGLTGPIPASLGSLPALEQLKLYGNGFTGEVPASLGGLTRLSTLWLGGNPGLAAGPVPAWVRGMRGLTSLELGQMNLTGEVPGWLGELTLLEDLQLDRNGLTGPIPDALGRLTRLAILTLDDNPLDPGPVPAWLGSLRALEDLLLGSCNRTGPFPSFLASLPVLRWLDVSRNSLSGDFPADIEFPAIQYLYLQSNMLTGPAAARAARRTAPLADPSVDVRWNAFAPKDPAVRQFLDAAQPGWSLTQTAPPEGVAVASTTSASVTLAWTPVLYTADGGGTRVYVATQAGGPYVLAGTTVAKAAGTFAVTGLAPSTTYRFVLRTVTTPHANNANTVESSPTAEVVATTSSAPCPALAAPAFTSAPSGPVTAGSAFTVAWTPVVQASPGGTYQVDLAANDACSSPLRLVVSQPSVAVATAAGVDATWCLVVRAVDGAGCTSPPSAPAKVKVKAAAPIFVVVAPQQPPATAMAGQPVTATSTVVLENAGAAAGSLTLAAAGGFFSVTPAGPVDVTAGGRLTATVSFDAGASQAAGVRQGALVVSWAAAGATASVSVPVTLTVLAGPPAAGGRLQPVGTNEVHFRAPAGSAAPSSEVTVRNVGSAEARLLLSIGPGGAWLKVDGDLETALPAGAERTLRLSVDRGARTAGDGTPPVLTGLSIDVVDGEREDGALFTVLDEEPPPVQGGGGRLPLGPSEFSLVVGSSVSAVGARDTVYLSDGWLRNRGSDPVVATLTYTPDGADGLTGSGVVRSVVSLAPYATYRLADFVSGLFGASGSGQVEVRSSALPQLSLRATADAVTVRDGALARYGAEIPVLVSGQGASAAALVAIAGIRGPEAGFRTNVILAETSGAAATVEVSLFTGAGALAGRVTREVKAWSKGQVNASDPGLFPSGTRYDGGTLEVRRLSGDGTVAAFATAIDDVSGSFATRVGQLVPILPAGASALAASAPVVAYLPAAAHAAGANDSFYRTTLVLSNPTATAAQLSLTFLPDGGQTPVGPKAVSLGARAEGPKALVLDDVLLGLFGVDRSTAGMIRIEGDVTRVLVASDTWTYLDLADPSRGRSVSSLNPAPGSALSQLGVFTSSAREVVGALESGAEQRVVSHPAVEEGRAFRTNLILAELAGKPSTVRVRLVPKAAGGSVVAEKTYFLAANERRQVNRVVRELLAAGDAELEQRELEVSVEALSGEGRVLALVTKIDNAPASKRADIFTLGGAVSQSGAGIGR